jgi:hypothetical protein
MSASRRGEILYPMLTSPSGRRCSGRRVHLRRRRGLADGLGSQLREDRGLYAPRERVTIVSGDVGKLFDQSGGFFVG